MLSQAFLQRKSISINTVIEKWTNQQKNNHLDKTINQISYEEWN